MRTVLVILILSNISISFSQSRYSFLKRELKIITLPNVWNENSPEKNFWNLVSNSQVDTFETIICNAQNECIDITIKEPFYFFGQIIHENENYLYFTYEVHDLPAYHKGYLVVYDKKNSVKINQLLISACLYQKIKVVSAIDKRLNIEIVVKEVLHEDNEYKIIQYKDSYKLNIDGRIEKVENSETQISFVNKVMDCDF